jgi:hypothetical protein
LNFKSIPIANALSHSAYVLAPLLLLQYEPLGVLGVWPCATCHLLYFAELGINTCFWNSRASLKWNEFMAGNPAFERDHKIWMGLCEAAVFELNRAKLVDRVNAAREAVQARLQELGQDNTLDLRERRQLADALKILDQLMRTASKAGQRRPAA